jgi:hypothetical protein
MAARQFRRQKASGVIRHSYLLQAEQEKNAYGRGLWRGQ